MDKYRKMKIVDAVVSILVALQASYFLIFFPNPTFYYKMAQFCAMFVGLFMCIYSLCVKQTEWLKSNVEKKKT